MKSLSSLLPVGLALSCLGLLYPGAASQDIFVSPLVKLIQASATLGETVGLVSKEKSDKIVREGTVNKTPKKENKEGEDDDEEDYEDVDFEDDDELLNFDAFAAQNGNSVTHFRRRGGEVMVPCFGMWWPVGGGGGGGGVGGGGYEYYGGYYDDDYRRSKRKRSKRRRRAKMKKRKKA